MEGILMAKPLLPDKLWEIIQPLLPARPPRPKGGRPPVDDRQALTGIIFVLKTGIPWEYLPQEMGCGCGMTCWRRLRDWYLAGVWNDVHHILLNHLRQAKRIDFSRFLVDAIHLRAVGGGSQTGPSPVDRRKLGSKMHEITDAQGVPLATRMTPANVNEVEELIPLVDAVPPIAGQVGHPRRRPDKLQGDRAYQSAAKEEELRRRKIEPVVAHKRTKHGSGLGKFRWFIERTLSWFKQFRRLRIRYERRAGFYYAFWKLASAIICFRILTSGFS
jgi:transposase